MAIQVSVTKVEQRSKTRKLPFLPRVGLVVEVAGRRFAIKGTPMLETLLNLREKGLSLQNFKNVAGAELAEISFPALKRNVATVKKTVKDVVKNNVKSIREGASGASKPLRKAAPKVALKKKTTEAAPSPEAVVGTSSEV